MAGGGGGEGPAESGTCYRATEERKAATTAARLVPVLVVSILVGLATLLGLIVFIISGIYIGVRLAVSVQALVVEDRRGTQAMRRSWDLVGGHWWHAAFTVLLAGLLTRS